MGVQIHYTAHKHGYEDPDIRHALRNPMFIWPPDDDGFEMIVGPSRAGVPLEIGFVRSSDDDMLVIHAARARKKFLRGRR